MGPGWSLGLMDVCAEWPHGEVPANLDQPVRSDVPVLLLTGRLDPSMSPAWAKAATQALPNAMTVVVREGSHNFIGMSRTDCLIGVLTDFVAGGSAEGLDLACFDAMRRPPFAVP